MKRLYHFIPAKYGVEAIQKRRLKLGELKDVNDPFELRSLQRRCAEYEITDYDEGVEELGKRFGFTSFSERWDNILMWSQYADRHMGMCLGFDVNASATGSYDKLFRVRYVERQLALPPSREFNEAFMGKMLSTKSKGWKFEREWRAFSELNEAEWNESANRNLYFVDFGEDLILREVLLGVRCQVEEIHNFPTQEPYQFTVKRVKLSLNAFRLMV